jgi:hypothetical protein
MCLACGYRGPDLQAGRAVSVLRCPECGEDLYSRPPRSYRELEGFVEQDEPEPEPTYPEPETPVSATREFFARAAFVLRRLLRRFL